MDWTILPALLGATVMLLFGVAAAIRPESLAGIGIAPTSPLGRTEIRSVFGGMFVALGAACLVLREPVVFGVVGSAWLADVAIRLVAVFIDRVPFRQALAVIAVGGVVGAAIASGYWLA